MSEEAKQVETIGHATHWRADRDQYLVDPAFRDDDTGKLYHPTPEPRANRWVIIREIQDDADPYELPTPVLVGEFEDSNTAELICDLIRATAGKVS